MKIAIIGAGHVGLSLATAWSRAGHEIVLGVKDPLQEIAETHFQRAMPIQAAAAAEIVVLSLPWAVAQSVIEGLGDLDNKIVIDCMNPLGMVDGKLGLVVGHDTSGGEMVAAWAKGGRVVKSLNQVGAEVMADASGFGGRPVMFIAGNDADAKTTVAALVHDIGFAPQDAGALSQARILEPFAMVWINQALMRGKGRNWALVAVDRNTGA